MLSYVVILPVSVWHIWVQSDNNFNIHYAHYAHYAQLSNILNLYVSHLIIVSYVFTYWKLVILYSFSEFVYVQNTIYYLL